uniref:Uncharacterized protein n=1 Tax=Arundo donax TaxID=35708 RepID=A0A0A9FLH9_ARUDO
MGLLVGWANSSFPFLLLFLFSFHFSSSPTLLPGCLILLWRRLALPCKRLGVA